MSVTFTGVPASVVAFTEVVPVTSPTFSTLTATRAVLPLVTSSSEAPSSTSRVMFAGAGGSSTATRVAASSSSVSTSTNAGPSDASAGTETSNASVVAFPGPTETESLNASTVPSCPKSTVTFCASPSTPPVFSIVASSA